MRASTDERAALPALIDRWVADGLITSAQAGRMRGDLGLTEPAPVTGRTGQGHRRTALVVEALAYLGGVIVLVAASLIAARYWGSLADGARLGIAGGAAAALLLAGFGVPEAPRPANVRLRAVLWLLATAGTGGFFALFADRVLRFDGPAVGLTASVGAATLAALLWWRLPVLAQQTAFFVAIALVAATAVAQLVTRPHLPGLAVWGTGVVWFLLGWFGKVKPRRPVLALAAAVALTGTLMTLPTGAGGVLAICTLVAVVVVAVVIRDLLLLVVGAVGALNILPAVITEWFPGQLAAPLVLLAVGTLLVVAAVYVAKVREKP
ncbi:DUF2157 domain-containing protein [Kribbella solani]|uniref:DUF2157 domain-containing protein n=1 Tax=Kribbella solani TaxID=236067 RepID=A0A841DKS8_9ACTN|nr:DUF2157 domain-containing protein [Kribbella solani]MBB5978501.1 hypothetical protein [Kribbella solani]